MQRLLRGGLIQPRLTVNAPGDEFEEEADRVAEQVMRMPAATSGAEIERLDEQSGLQRKCASCEEDKLQRLATPGQDAEEERDELRLKRRSSEPAEVTPELEALIREQQSSGSTLPAATRQFFETRMGRDFSQVRLHTGARAAALSDAVQAYAFTHGQHIWLGAGLSAEPSPVLAHELVHVVQQSATPPLAGQAARAVRGQSQPGIQRFAPYWEPFDYNGTLTHREVLPQISQKGKIFVEAPVPNAQRDLIGPGSSFGNGKQGAADLYEADGTVGVYFREHLAPVSLGSPRGLLHNGKRYNHLREAAPQVSVLRDVTRVDLAPPSIKVGDLKPSHGTMEAAEGADQVANYLEGFRWAQRSVADMAAANRARPAGSTWTLTTSRAFNYGELNSLIPDQYRENATTTTPRALVLKQGRHAIRPPIRTSGRLVLRPDPTNAGILNYVWVPAQMLNITLPQRVRALGTDVVNQILNPLIQAPTRRAAPGGVARKEKPEEAKEPSVEPVSPVALRKPGSTTLQLELQDNFDLTRWRASRRELGQRFRQMRGTTEYQDARSAALVVEAHQAIESSTGLNLPEPGQATQEAPGVVNKIEFWTGRTAAIFGPFRRVFGRVFVRVADAIARMRERFQQGLRNRRSPDGGGMMGAAIKAAFSVMKMAGLTIVRQMINLLQDALVSGLGRKLTTLMGSDNIEELQTRVAEVRLLREQLEQQALQSAQQLVEQTIGDYTTTIEQIEHVSEIVSDIRRIVNWVRWGARAIACVSAPALGCLWVLGERLLDEFAGRVIQSCWFQRRIAPLILSIEFVRNLPRTLAELIVRAVRGILPESLHDIFADIRPASVNPDEIECDDSEGSGAPLTEEQRAVLGLQERLGEERFLAFLELARAAGVPAGVPLTQGRAAELTRIIQESGATAAQMRQWAAQYTRPESGVPVDLRTFLTQMQQDTARSQTTPAPPPPEGAEEAAFEEAAEPPTTTVPGETTEPVESLPEFTTVVVGRRPAVSVLEANAHDETRTGTRDPQWRIQVTRIRGHLQEEQDIQVDVRLTRQTERGRREIRVIRRLEVWVEEIENLASQGYPTWRRAKFVVSRQQAAQFGTTVLGFFEGDRLHYDYRLATSAPAETGR